METAMSIFPLWKERLITPHRLELLPRLCVAIQHDMASHQTDLIQHAGMDEVNTSLPVGDTFGPPRSETVYSSLRSAEAMQHKAGD